MKKLLLSMLLLSAVVSQGQLLKKASGLLNKSSSSKASGLSSEEIIAGLKDALSVGAQNSASKLSALNGFFGNAVIKVLLPDEVKKVETALRSVGMGKIVDDAILSMNRAAEEASKSAAPIFVDAIKSMTVSDGLGILRGSDSAATNYLRGKTTGALTTAFRPVIESALQKTNATKYWKDLVDTYNKLPTTIRKINPDLAGHVTEKGLNGLFYQVAEEESKIRKDPAARVTDILKKVFGS